MPDKLETGWPPLKVKATRHGHGLQKNPPLLAQFRLMPRYRSNGIPTSKPDRGETAFHVYGLRPTRRVDLDGSFRTEIVAIVQQHVPMRLDQTTAPQGTDGDEEFIWFRGGATVIIDLPEGNEKIRFSIIKNTDNETRRRLLEASTATYLSQLRALNFVNSRAAWRPGR